jgi:DNA-binding NarL/FixJ family response regulator
MIERRTNRPNRPCDARLVNKVILVADDNPVMRDALCKLFEPEDGLELCEQAVNGQDAIDKAKKFRPDLIILFTIHGDEMLSAAAKEAGIEAFVSKAEMVNLPVHTRALLKRA